MTTVNKRYSYSRVVMIQVLASEDRLARPSSWVTSSFLPHNSLGVGGRCFSQMVTHLHHLNEPISPACDRYIQYWRPTHRPLIDTGGATALKVSAFHTPLPDLPNRRSPPFHLRAPPGLQFIQNLSTKSEFEF
jgi:hypothetical protein